MPELPDVEVFRRYLARTVCHRPISSVTVRDRAMLKGMTPDKLRGRLKNHRFNKFRRHGKYLFAEINRDGWLVMHFGMTGFVQTFTGRDPDSKFDRIVIHFDDGGRLGYYSRRRLGHMEFVDEPMQFIERRGLGIDALDPKLDVKRFSQILGERGMIKTALMDQARFAGIGNIYSDEILFQARLHPRMSLAGMDTQARRPIYNKMRSVLQKAISAKADPERLPRTWLIPRRKKGEPCPRCGTKIKQLKMGGRSSYYCPACQPRQ